MEDLYSEPRPVEHQQIRGGALRSVRTPKAIGAVSGTIAKPKPLGPETSWSYFHPNRVDVRFAPAWFRARLHALDPNLDVTWHPIHERWCVFVRNPRVTYKTSPGWQLLFPVKYSSGAYMPLDERTFAEIVNRSPRKWGNGLKYWNRCVEEMERDRKRKRTAHDDLVGAIAREKYDACQIQVSMCGASVGSKFVNHHSGN